MRVGQSLPFTPDRGHPGTLVTIGVGIIGYGYWGPNLLRNFAERDDVTVRACADLSPERRALAGQRHPGVRITADAADNSILVYSNQEEYRVIERSLREIDRPKLQVAIDATVAEVTLTDELQYGVRYFFTVAPTSSAIAPSVV